MPLCGTKFKILRLDSKSPPKPGGFAYHALPPVITHHSSRFHKCVPYSGEVVSTPPAKSCMIRSEAGMATDFQSVASCGVLDGTTHYPTENFPLTPHRRADPLCQVMFCPVRRPIMRSRGAVDTPSHSDARNLVYLCPAQVADGVPSDATRSFFKVLLLSGSLVWFFF